MNLMLVAAIVALPYDAAIASPGVSPPVPKPLAVAATPSKPPMRRAVRPWPRNGDVARVAAANRAATLEPQALSFVNAVQVYPFSDGAIFQVYTAPGAVTDIALQAGEGLVSVGAGDTVRWVIGDTTSGSGPEKRTHILVKPIAAGLASNLVITTDRRAYHLQLAATSRTAMAAVSWSYPADQLIALRRAADQAVAAAPVSAGLSVDDLHFNYVVSGGAPAWRPLRAFDDGRQTYVEFPASIAVGEAPPLFIVGPAGDAELVNYRVRGRYYVVDRIFDAAELRLGAQKQQVVRIERVADGVAASKGGHS